MFDWICKTIEPSEVHALNVSTLHTTHCLPNGNVMISTMGDANGNGKGDFLLIDADEGVVKGRSSIVKLWVWLKIQIFMCTMYLFIYYRNLDQR